VFTAFRALGQIPQGFGPSVITIGNFDGVHLGHTRILREVVAIARQRGLVSASLTFHPHPAKIVAPDRVPPLLTSPEARLALFENAGLDATLILPFTPEIAHLLPEEFIERVLVHALAARVIVVGANFRFGRNHAGDVRLLESEGRRWNYEVRVIEPVVRRGEIVSSSRIRRLISQGAVSSAAHLLGRPFVVEGPVIPGHGIGSRQTVPTLNIDPETEVIPARGVYTTCAMDSGSERRWPAVTNIGYRPTFGGTDLSIETFLLRPLEGADPATLSLAFWRRLRDERKFPSPDELRQQIWKDVAATEKFYRRLAAVARTPVPG